VRLGLITSVLVVSCAAAGRAATETLATVDTILVLEAGSESPRVVSLANSAGVVWKNQQPEPFVERVQVDGRWIPVHWKLQSFERSPDVAAVTAVYACATPRMRLEWQWQARDRIGPLEHTIRIENLEERALTLPLQNSFAFDWAVLPSARLRHLWVEKGAGSPSAEGTHDAALAEGFRWEGRSSTYAPDVTVGQREPIPWMLVEETGPRASGWYLGVEFSGRARLGLSRKGVSLSGEAGLDPLPGPFLASVPVKGSFVTPTVFLGAFGGDYEAAGNILRRWETHVLLDPAHFSNPTYPLLVNNSWGSGMDITEQKARGMIEDSASLGIEMFHLDAGWFRGVGDWYPDSQKFPHGIATLADAAHRRGQKFGLWVDWTQAGTDTVRGALNVHDPEIRDWLTRDPEPGWKPEAFKGITIDIGYPPARAWAARELDRMVREYHLDMLEHDGYLVAQGCVRTDHPHAACAGGSSLGPPPWLEGSCSTDVSYHAARSYYTLYEELRRHYPHLLLEACNDGGRMVDFGTAAHTDYFSITDTYDPLSNRRAFYDASHLLPPSMLECYVERYPIPRLATFLYMLRSGMMGWCTLMQDTNAWTAEQYVAAREAFQLYKTQLRPLIRDADLYHISDRPDGVHWDGLEYFAPRRGHGVVYAFRGTTPDEANHLFRLRGLDAGREYALHFEDHSSPDRAASGRELMSAGLKVSLTGIESSELVFLREIDGRNQRATSCEP
jgi:alpha-galactosidase